MAAKPLDRVAALLTRAQLERRTLWHFHILFKVRTSQIWPVLRIQP